MPPLVAVYLATPGKPQSFDTYPTRYLAVSLAERRDFDLDEWPEQLELAKPAYWIYRRAGHLYSAYPPGPALLAAPLWPLFRLAGFHADPAPVFALARTTAALYVAAAAALLHAALSRFGLVRAAGLTTLGFALGSGNLALASQDLWQHGPAELGLALALYGMVGDRPRDGWWCGFGLGLAAAMRPVLLSVAVVAALGWLAGHRGRGERREVLRFAAGFVLLPSVAALCNVAVFGSLIGGYSQELLGSAWRGQVLTALLGHVLSPSRGVLVFWPWVVFAVPGALALWRRAPRFGATLVAASLGFLLLVSLRAEWWAGHGYGPRYPLDVLPLVAFAAAAGIEGFRARAPREAVACVGLLIAFATLAQLPAFLGDEGTRWSGSPNVDRFPARLWDVADGQLAAGWNQWLEIPFSSYEVARLPHLVGDGVEDRRFPGDRFVACAAAGERGVLAFGPGHRFSAGRYVARFHLAVDQPGSAADCAAGSPAAILEITGNRGNPVWARTEEPACAGPVAAVELPFELERARRTELRIETTGAARVCASRIDLVRER